jgi:predicted PurR-regulated permease PerM
MNALHREARFLLGAVLLLGLLGFLVILPYVNTITLAVVIGITFMPVAERIKRVVRHESITALITLLIALVLVVTPLAFFSYRAGGEAVGLYDRFTRDHNVGQLTTQPLNLTRYTDALPVSLRDAIPHTIDVSPVIRSVGSWVVGKLGPAVGVVTTLILDIFLLIMATYYVLKDGNRFVKYLITLVPIDSEYEATLFKKLHASVISVVRGSIVIAIIQGVVAGIGFYVLGVPNAALWGSATVIASLIPIVGTALTLVPAIVYLVFTGSLTSALLLLLWGMLIVGFVDNAFRGQLMKKGMDVHPFLILLSVLGGFEFFGPIGFISGPLLLAIFMALLDIYVSYRERFDSIDTPATLNS